VCGALSAGALNWLSDTSENKQRNTFIVVATVAGIAFFSNEQIASLLPEWKNQTKKHRDKEDDDLVDRNGNKNFINCFIK
jgi:hypothetical protein